jgi:hypothetical protein
MRKRTYSYLAASGLAAAAATAVLALGAAPALAATGHTVDTLTVSKAGGTNVKVKDALDAALSGTSVFTTSAGNLSCTAGSFASTVKTNSATKATETVTGLSFTPSSCSSGITGTTGVISIGLKTGTAPVATVTASTSKLTVKPTATVVLGTILGNVTCYYSGSLTGTLSNTNHSLVFTKAKMTSQTGSSSLCPSTGTFTATYAPITDTTQGKKDVYVN